MGLGISNAVQESYNYIPPISSSTNVMKGRGILCGIFVSAASSTPTITIYDDAATGTGNPLISVFTPVAATFYPFHAFVGNGIYIVISGTVSCTPLIVPSI
jgi:hypothetical protein